jgi:hypothetical protein
LILWQRQNILPSSIILPLLQSTLPLLITTMKQLTSTVMVGTKRPNNTQLPRTSMARRLISTRSRRTCSPASHLIRLLRCCLGDGHPKSAAPARRVATRYEKTARNYLAIVALAATILWLR